MNGISVFRACTCPAAAKLGKLEPGELAVCGCQPQPFGYKPPDNPKTADRRALLERLNTTDRSTLK